MSEIDTLRPIIRELLDDENCEELARLAQLFYEKIQQLQRELDQTRKDYFRAIDVSSEEQERLLATLPDYRKGDA